MGCAPQFQMPYQIEQKRLILVLVLAFSVFLVLQSWSLFPGSLLLSVLNFNSTAQSIPVHNSTSHSKSLSGESMDLDLNSSLHNVGFPDKNSSFGKSDNEKSGLNVSTMGVGFVSHPFVTSPMPPTTNSTSLHQSGLDLGKNNVSTTLSIPSMGKEANETLSKVKLPTPNSNSTTKNVTKRKRMPPATPISEMTRILFRNRVSSHAMIPRWSSIRDQELLFAKSQIESVTTVRSSRELYAPLYRNVSTFKRSYKLMETTFKVYIYSEGDKPIFHQPKLKGIYASEGWFMKLMEGNKQFVVKDPTKAHMFYLPFSTLNLRYTLIGNSKHHKHLSDFLNKYVSLIAGKYNFWNRTSGADHFLVACHDWASQVTSEYMGTCIRALCNSNVALGFELGKDVSLPVTFIPFANDTLRGLGGKPSSKRPFLAFFAGHMHGYVRPILLQYWEKDPDMKIFGPLPRNAKPNYIQYMKSSKYCICARGYEVHTPRVVEAIFHECVPVIISDNYVPPFFEVLNWEAFSVFVLEKDIPNLKKILLSIPGKKYQEMQRNVGKVQKHFLWHKNPVKYDIFHDTSLNLVQSSISIEGQLKVFCKDDANIHKQVFSSTSKHKIKSPK